MNVQQSRAGSDVVDGCAYLPAQMLFSSGCAYENFKLNWKCREVVV
jgi:hypothetical protein